MPHKPLVWKSEDLAKRYLEGVRGAIPMAGEQIELLLRVAGIAVPDARRILDLGCGDGILGRALMDQYPEARCTFSDYSVYMLAAARQKCPADRSESVLADYGDPAWVDAVANSAPFEIIVSGFSIHHQPDERKQTLYRELYDLTSPGGIFLNLEHITPFSKLTSKAFNEMFIDNLCAGMGAGKSREEVADAYYNRPDKEANILASVTDNCRWLREAGFVEVDCFSKVLELALFGGMRPL